MEEIIFTFPSFTYANKAKKVLLKSGISTVPTKLGPEKSSIGCVHGLAVSRSDYYSAVRIFLENKIEYGLEKK